MTSRQYLCEINAVVLKSTLNFDLTYFHRTYNDRGVHKSSQQTFKISIVCIGIFLMFEFEHTNIYWVS